jgi:hypothetical protein
MKLEHQVCTLEQAKKLHTLGLREKSYFVWHDRKLKNPRGELYIRDRAEFDGTNPIYSAFSCAELGVMLANLKECNFALFVNLLIHLLKNKHIKPEDLKL